MPDSAPITISIGVGVCAIHGPMSGIMLTGYSNVDITNLDTGYNSSIVLANCGDIGIMVSGASKVVSGGNNKSRVGGAFAGVFTGTIVSGSGSVVLGA